MELHFPLILDGATGTELQRRGYTGDISMEKWTLAHPDCIRELQRGYVDAGSQVLYTPTFGGNAVRLAAHGVTGDVAAYNRRLAALTREAAGGRALVAGDMAPTGLFPPPWGDATFERLVDAYAQQVAGLEAAGVDLYVIETMISLSDARAAVLAVRAVTDKPDLCHLRLRRERPQHLRHRYHRRSYRFAGHGHRRLWPELLHRGADAAPAPAAAGVCACAADRQAQRRAARYGGWPGGVRLLTGGVCLLRTCHAGQRRDDFRRLLRHHGGAYCRPAPRPVRGRSAGGTLLPLTDRHGLLL